MLPVRDARGPRFSTSSREKHARSQGPRGSRAGARERTSRRLRTRPRPRAPARTSRSYRHARAGRAGRRPCCRRASRAHPHRRAEHREPRADAQIEVVVEGGGAPGPVVDLHRAEGMRLPAVVVVSEHACTERPFAECDRDDECRDLSPRALVPGIRLCIHDARDRAAELRMIRVRCDDVHRRKNEGNSVHSADYCRVRARQHCRRPRCRRGRKTVNASLTRWHCSLGSLLSLPLRSTDLEARACVRLVCLPLLEKS
jgi:hypothetical protein